MEKKIIELRERRMKTWENAKAFLNSKRNNDGTLSAEDTAIYNKMETELDNLGSEIKRLEKLETVENELRKPTDTPVNHSPIRNGGNHQPFATKQYRKAFWDALRGEVISNALKIGSDPEGGYLVPDEFEKKLVKALEERNVMRRLANIIRTKHGERQIPVVATKGTAAWVDEEALIPESDSTFGQVTLGAHKVATMIKVSGELLNDSAFSIEEYVANEFARRIAAKEEEAFFVGDGNKKPTGILAETGGAEVGATAASATAITHDDVLNLFYSLKSPYREKAVFIANDLTVKELRKLKDSAGQYLWTPSIKDGTPDMIIGRPIYTSPYVPEIAAGAKTLVFGDYSYYWIADRQSRTFQRLNEMFATTGQIGFIATQRVDGKLILPEAVRVLQMKAE
jgi:HK97 family phage major capsid protein